jgi:hypothetical protein
MFIFRLLIQIILYRDRKASDFGYTLPVVGVLLLTLWTELLALPRAVLVGVSSWVVVIAPLAILLPVIVAVAMSDPGIPPAGLTYLLATAAMAVWVGMSNWALVTQLLCSWLVPTTLLLSVPSAAWETDR